jgi:hypothetical protein
VFDSFGKLKAPQYGHSTEKSPGSKIETLLSSKSETTPKFNLHLF